MPGRLLAASHGQHAAERASLIRSLDVTEGRRPENNHVLRIELPPALRRYVFGKGYTAVNG